MISAPAVDYLNRVAVQRAAVVAMASVCTAVVVYYGWISDDGLITFRYIRNLLEGNGPVYNTGDRVQGYTHPLWLLLLTPVQAVVGEPVVTASLVGGALTFAAIAYLGFFMLRRWEMPRALGFFALLAGLLVSSEAWRSFQTSGLENSLSNLLVALLVVELFRPAGARVFATTLLCSLLVLSRPDLLLLIGPLGAYIALRAWRQGTVRELLLAGLPVALWVAFAFLYYGTVVPNTANTKVGVYSLLEGIEQGVRFLIDWWVFEPGSIIVLVLFVWVAMRLIASVEHRLFALGVLIYFGYVIYIGGDFMRGRFFMPVLMGASCLTAFALLDAAQAGKLKGWEQAVPVIALGVMIVWNLFIPPPADPRIRSGIVNERLVYDGTTLQQYVREGAVRYNVFSPERVANFNRFAEACGPFAVRSPTAGGFAYLARLDIAVIDTIGLTDRYIASLGDSYLRGDRIGHPTRAIPLRYLASRHDITIFSDWEQAVAEGNCAIIEATQRYTSPDLGDATVESVKPVFKGQPAH